MAGIQIHTADPISPSKAKALYPQTNLDTQIDSTPNSTSSAMSPNTYPPARPGQGVPAPTKTSSPPYSLSGPAQLQPKTAPSPPPPATTAKATLPPPPRAGEKMLPPEEYNIQPTAPRRTSPPLSQPYPPQMSHTLQNPPTGGIPPSAETAPDTRPSYGPPTTLPVSSNPSATPGSLEHPPGYVQNQHATEMTPEQRLALQEAEAQKSAQSDPILGYPDGRSRSSSNGSITAAGIWEGAKTLVGQVSQKAGELHGELWEKINREN